MDKVKQKYWVLRFWRSPMFSSKRLVFLFYRAPLPTTHCFLKLKRRKESTDMYGGEGLSPKRKPGKINLLLEKGKDLLTKFGYLNALHR